MATTFQSVRLIARLAGVPTSAIRSLGSPSLETALAQLYDAERAIAAMRDEVSSTLHDIIGRTTDRSSRNRLMVLRRGLYNGKPAQPAQCEVLLADAASDERQRVLPFNQQLSVRDAVRARILILHQSERARVRQCLQGAIADDAFQKGILLSSQSLFLNLKRYQQTDPNSISSRDQQIERGLLRYLTRASMKATPFASFCTVLPVRLVEANLRRPRIAESTAKRRSYVRLNKAIYTRLWKQLQRVSVVRDALAVEINPTVERSGDRLRFLASFDGHEVFQRVAATPAVDIILDLARQAGELSRRELANLVAANPTLDASSDEIGAYIDSLITTGLLRLRPVVPEQTADWDVPLRQFLVDIDHDQAQRSAHLLGELRTLVDTYTTGDVSARASALQAMRAALVAGFEAIGCATDIPRNLPIFEDVSCDAELELPRSKDLADLIGVVAAFAEALTPLAWNAPDCVALRHFVDTQYPERESISVLTLYEDYYRAHLKEFLARRRRALRESRYGKPLPPELENPFGLETVSRVTEARRLVERHIAQAWSRRPDAEEISVSLGEIREALKALPGRHETFGSVAAFCQLLFDENANCWRCVLKRPMRHQGFGKFFSRFLHALPPFIEADLVQANEHLTHDVLAEIAGDAEFNANLHPPLLPFEIDHPSGSGTSNSRRIIVSELDVVRDPERSDRLQLLHRGSCKRVHPIDLGFLNPDHRPPLHQLLAAFTPSPTAGFFVPLSPYPSGDVATAPAPGQTAGGVLRRPRIVIANRVVVARQRWTIPGKLFPVAGDDQSEAELFLRINAWRAAHGMPIQVYVQIFEALRNGGEVPKPRDASANVEGDASETASSEKPADAPLSQSPLAKPGGRSRDFAKPQYIDFSSPLLVSLFARLPTGLEGFNAAVEECYPSREHLAHGPAGSVTSEFVLQIDQRAHVERSDPREVAATERAYA